jgi:hypothetical protein
LLLYNAVALFVEADATMEVSRSIVRNNQTNALATAGALVTATNVWWGAADLATVQSNHVGNVVCEPLLTAEPVLTPAADAHDGNRTVGVASITLALAARVAEAVQISEDSLFTGSFFDPFTTPKSVALSAGGGLRPFTSGSAMLRGRSATRSRCRSPTSPAALRSRPATSRRARF